MNDESNQRADSGAASAGGLEVASRVLPLTLHVLPLSQRPFLPVQTMPITVPEAGALETFTEAGKSPQRMLGLLLTRDEDVREPQAADLHQVGTAVRIHHAARHDGHIQFVAEGVQRFRIEDELEKFSVLESGSPEYAVTRNYLDWLTILPWGVESADQLDSIPPALLDRMETIRLSGYIAEEKLAIARRHLWPRALERAGIVRRQLTVTDSALRALVEGYAREAGVRGLDKQLGRIVRKAAVRIARGETGPIRINRDNLQDYLGKPLFLPGANRRDVEELPEYLRAGLDIHYADDYETVFALAFPQRKRSSRRRS